MKKIKFLIASMLGAIALVFACVLGTKVTAASLQPYVNASFANLTADADNKTLTSNNTEARRFVFNNFEFNIPATSTGTKSHNSTSNGVRIKAVADEMYFTTKAESKVTITIYDSTNGRKATVKNSDKEITDIAKDMTQITTPTKMVSTDDDDTNYTYTVTVNSNLQIVTINHCPAGKIQIINPAGGDMFVNSVKIQPYATVTYNTNGGTSISSAEALYGETFTPSNSTTKEGFNFQGWYTDSNLATPFDTTAPVLDDVTLYADWADANAVYNVSFILNGVSYCDSIDVAYDSNGDATIGSLMPSNPSAAIGYAFDGWYTKDGSSTGDWGTKVTSETTISSSMVSNKAIVLYAKFSAASSYIASFGEGTITSTKEVSISDNITLKEVVKHDNRQFSFNGQSLTKYTQAKEIDFTLTNKAEVTFYLTQTNKTNYVSDVTCCIQDSNGNKINGTGFIADFKTNAGDSKNAFSFVLPSGSYKLVAFDIQNMYGVKIDYDTTKDAISTTNFENFQWQLDSTTKTIARFIGTISGVEDITKLDNVYVEVVLLGSYSYIKSGDSKATTGNYAKKGNNITINKVYKAVIGSGDSSKETVQSGIYYAVCSISGLNNLKTAADSALATSLSGVTYTDLTCTWTIKAKLYYTYNGVENVISIASAVSGF